MGCASSVSLAVGDDAAHAGPPPQPGQHCAKRAALLAEAEQASALLPAGADNPSAPSGSASRGTSVSAVLPKYISADELGQLCQASHFDRKQVERLYEVFKVISSSNDDDGLIDKSEFEASLGLRSSLFVDRIFAIFDSNSDRGLTFHEFVLGLSTFSARAPQEAKAAMSFRIHDLDGDGLISREDLSRMMRATVAESALQVSAEQLDVLIATTFEQAGAADKPGLTLDDFNALVRERPAMLANMTIGWAGAISAPSLPR